MCVCMCEKKQHVVGVMAAEFLVLVALHTFPMLCYVSQLPPSFCLLFQCLFSIRENRVCSRPPLQCCFDSVCMFCAAISQNFANNFHGAINDISSARSIRPNCTTPLLLDCDSCDRALGPTQRQLDLSSKSKRYSTTTLQKPSTPCPVNHIR